MFVGHYSVAFAVKSERNKIPLWVLFVAVQLLDFLWAPFVLLGVEKVRMVPGITATNSLDLYYMPYTHSLIGALLWSGLAALVFKVAAEIIALRKMEENKFAIGSRLGKGVFNHWLAEQLSGLNVHVRYLHTKYMLVDPLGDNPLVVSGSANFSDASTTDNDENMVIIRGNSRVADIYLGEFMRLYRHFAFRDWLSQHPDADEVQVGHLDETDHWWKRYFGSTFDSRQRSYFVS